jgi:hypothetical protein
MRIFVYALVAWTCLAALSTVTDVYFVFRSPSGRHGARVLALTREHAAGRRGAQVGHDQSGR